MCKHHSFIKLKVNHKITAQTVLESTRPNQRVKTQANLLKHRKKKISNENKLGGNKSAYPASLKVCFTAVVSCSTVHSALRACVYMNEVESLIQSESLSNALFDVLTARIHNQHHIKV